MNPNTQQNQYDEQIISEEEQDNIENSLLGKHQYIYYTLNDTKECKNEYETVYKSNASSIYVSQEINYLHHEFIDGVYNLKIDIVPTDITKRYEICASFYEDDKYFYNIGNIIFYGIFNESNTLDIISGVPFSFEINQFYSKYDLFIRLIYEKHGDSKTCRLYNNNFENVFLEGTIERTIVQHDKKVLDNYITNYKWKDVTIILDTDNNNYMTSYQNVDGSYNLYVCSCYELTEGHCQSGNYFSTQVMKFYVHTVELKEPKMNSLMHFLKPFTLKLETTKILNGSII